MRPRGSVDQRGSDGLFPLFLQKTKTLNNYEHEHEKILSVGSALVLTVFGIGLLVSTSAHAVAATTYYVDANATSSGTGTLASPFQTIQEGINAATSGDTVHVAAGAYAENPDVAAGITLQGASGADIEGQVTIAGDSVTVDGFNITDPNSSFGILATDHSNLTITNNTIHDIGTTLTSGSAQAIGIISSAADVTNITISDNHITNIGNTNLAHAGSAGSSAKGIYLGNSNGSYTFSGVTVSGNTINDVYASTAAWIGSPNYGGGAGAYGLLVNHKTTGLAVTGNTIGTLEGLWAHAIGLETDTPNATVSGNTVTGLTDHKGGTDAMALRLESNPDASTVTLTGNTFNGDPLLLSTSTISVNAAWNTLSTSSYTYPEVLSGGVYNYYGLNAFSKIQDGVNAVATGGTVNVAAGTYPETASIIKPLTLNGAQMNVPGANASGTQRSGGESIVNAMDISASNVTVNGFSFVNDGTQMNIGSSTILSGVVVKDNIFSGFKGVGVPTNHAGNLIIEGNLFKNADTSSEAIQIKSDSLAGGCNGTEVENNVLVNAGNNNGADINFSCTGSNSSNVTVSGNTDLGNTNGNSFTAFSGVNDGINVTGNHATNINGSAIFFWGDVSGSANVTNNVITGGAGSAVSIHGNGAYNVPDAPNSGAFTITNNDLSGNLRGIYLGDDGGAFTASSTIVASGNNFSGESIAGVQNSSTVLTANSVNATGNWWGASTGPADLVSGDGSIPDTNASGTGAAAIGAVKYSGWCTNSYCDSTPPTLVYNTPAANVVVSSTLPVSVTASDAGSGIADVVVHYYHADANGNATGTMLGACGSGAANLGGVPTYTYTCILDVSALSDGNYVLKSGTFDVAGNNQTVSLPFTVSHVAPSVSTPTLVWPVNGDITPTNVFTFRWNSSTSTVSGPITYEFHSSMNSAETNGVLTTGLWDSGTLTTSSILSTGAPDGTWYWQVRAKDSAGDTSAWSDIWAVTLNTAPTPALVTCLAGTTASLVETDTVHSASSTPTVGVNNLTDGQTYLLVASGTWKNATLNVTDPAYASVDNWTTYMRGYDIAPYYEGSNDLELQVDNSFVNWGAYQPSHEYAYLYTGTGNPVSFIVFDGNATVASPTPNPSWYGDNSGDLQVSVYACHAPTYVTTEAATNLAQADATLNGLNGDYNATGHSFWVSTSTFSTTSPIIPVGVYSTPDLGAIASGTPFSISLSSLTANAYVHGQVAGSMPAVTPNTTYYYVAWSFVNGTWHPGTMKSFTTKALNADDTLSALGVSAGELSPSFSPDTLSYNVVLPYNTTLPPTVTATTTDPDATDTVTQAMSTTGTATVHVTAQDGVTNQTYAVNFSLAPATTSFLNVVVLVDNSDGGAATSSDFTVTVIAPGASKTTFPGDAAGTEITIDPNQHFNVNISHVQHYDVGTSGDCNDPSGLPAGSLATCTITETYKAFGNDNDSVIVGGGEPGGGNNNGNDGGKVLGASITGVEFLQQQIAQLQQQLLALLQQYLAQLHSHGTH